MPFPGFVCQRCGECCRNLAATVLSFTEDELQDLERRGVGSDLETFRSDSRLSVIEVGETTTYEILDKQTAVEAAGLEVWLESEGEHCAFFTVDENDVPACGMELDYGIKPETCRDFPLDPEHGVKFSNCAGCRLVLGADRSDELRREAASAGSPPPEDCPF